MNNYQRMTRAELIRRLQAADETASGVDGGVGDDRLRHELEVHRIELETQNREVRDTQLLLESSRDSYADLYDLAPVGYLSLDASGVIRNINLTAATMFGAERSRLLGVPMSMYVSRQHLGRFRALLANVLRTRESESFELVLTPRQGGALPCLVRRDLAPQRDQESSLVRLVLSDLTALKEAERVRSETAALNNAVLASIGSGIAVIDRNGAVLSMNEAWKRISPSASGHAAPHSGVGSCVSKLCLSLLGCDREKTQRLEQGIRSVLDGSLSTFGTEYSVAVGQRRHRYLLSVVSLRLPCGGAVIAATDISQLRRTEDALVDNEARLRAVLESAAEAIITSDEHGVIESFNRTAEQLFGYSSSEILGRNLSTLMPSPYRDEHDRYLANYRHTGERRIIGIGREVEALRKDGRRFPIELAVSEVRLTDGRRIFTGFIRDITQRRQAEEALRASEAEFRSLSEASPLGICMSDTNGQCVYSNPRWQEMSGLTAEQNLGGGWLRIVLPADRPMLLDAWNASLGSGREMLCEFRIVRPDGGVRWIRARSKAITNREGVTTGFVGVDEDVTATKLQERLQALRYKVSTILASAGSVQDAVPPLLESIALALDWEVGEFWGVGEDQKTLRMVHVWHCGGAKVASFVRQSLKISAPMFDGLPGEVLLHRKSVLIPSISACASFHRKRQAVRAGLSSALAAPILLGDRVLGIMAFLARQQVALEEGQLALLTDFGHQVGQFVERKRAEQELREAHEFGKQVIGGAQAGIVVVDSKARFVVWNPFMVQLCGIKSDQVVGRQVVEVFEFMGGPPFKRMFVRALSGEVFDAADLPLDLPGDDRRVWISVRFSPWKDVSQRIVGVILAVRDITERRRLEAEVLSISDRERQSVGHELHDGLGQQLTALEMKCFLLQEDLKELEPKSARKRSQRNLQGICAALRECISVSRSLARGLAPVPYKAGGLVGALRQLAHMTSVPGKLRCHFRSSKFIELTDFQTSGHLYRIAQEAVNNAMKHGRARSILIRLETKRDGLLLQIKDSGRGLPDGVHDKSGMGLGVMRHRAQIIGATLDIDSQRGRGVCVTCKLPLKHYELEENQSE